MLLFRTLPLSFYYTHYCKILLYYIIYYIVNTQFSLVAASFLQINYLSIYLSIYLSKICKSRKKTFLVILFFVGVKMGLKFIFLESNSHKMETALQEGFSL